MRRRPGTFTIRTTAILFALSAIFEAFTITSAVPIFGDNRGGAVAAIIHLIYIALFGALGAGLWLGTRWGYQLVFGATAFYTLHKVLYVFDQKARQAELTAALASPTLKALNAGAYVATIEGMVHAAMTTTVLLMLCSWWGFALYIYVKRSYFDPMQKELEDILRRFGADTGTIHLLENGVLILKAQVGLPAHIEKIVQRVPIGKGMAGLAAEKNEPVASCNIQIDQTGNVRPVAKQTGVNGAIVVPIRDAQGNAQGAIGIGVHHVYEYNDEETQRLIAEGEALLKARDASK